MAWLDGLPLKERREFGCEKGSEFANQGRAAGQLTILIVIQLIFTRWNGESIALSSRYENTNLSYQRGRPGLLNGSAAAVITSSASWAAVC